MKKKINDISLTHLCASLASAIGIEPPAQADTPIPALDALVQRTCGKANRIFMYNPDAIAMWLCDKYREWYEPIFRNTSLTLPLCTVMPSVTPVCFGTMYTGRRAGEPRHSQLHQTDHPACEMTHRLYTKARGTWQYLSLYVFRYVPLYLAKIR